MLFLKTAELKYGYDDQPQYSISLKVGELRLAWQRLSAEIIGRLRYSINWRLASSKRDLQD